MRRFLIAVLLSGAAASPALAQDWNDHGHHHNQQNNGQAQPQQPRGEARGDRGNGGVYRQQAPQFMRQQPVQVQEGQRGAWAGQRFEGQAYVAPRAEVHVQQQAYGYRGYRGGFNAQPQQPEQARTWKGQRGTWNRDGGDYRQRVVVEQQPQQVRDWNTQHDTWNRDGGDYRQRVVVQQPGQVRNWNGQRGTWNRDGSRWAGGTSWDRDWRSDRRYDWRRYRDSHRSIFRIGIYYDPFGYGYQPFGIGYRLAQAYFGEQYWIDPAMYELPYPPPGTQWIRYWNDALLVDVYSGEVVDVVHDFFW